LGLGLGLGHPWATQGPRKRRPRVTQGSPLGEILISALFAARVQKMGGGAESPSSHVIADIARDRKGNLTADEHR
jgi:hypothetical protein